MSRNAVKTDMLTRFLLGDLPEDERARVEDSFLGDGELFEQLLDAENDLVDDYVADRLGAGERERFERNYLPLPEHREKVAAAKFLRRQREAKTNLVDVSAGTSFLQSIKAFFGAWHLAPTAVAFALLLLLVGSVWLALRPRPNVEVARNVEPSQTPQVVQPTTPPKAGGEENSNAQPNANEQAATTAAATPQHNINSASPRPSATPQPKPSPAAEREGPVVSLALIAGLVRGGGAANRLILPKDAARVRLTFELPAKGYKDASARIETVSGARVWQGNLKQSGGRVELSLPAKLFADEDYLLIVSGANAAGAREDFAQFYFNAERK